MPVFLWDASALAKRYAPETGSGVVNRLFAEAHPCNSATTVLGYAETFSLLLRKRNRRDLDERTFIAAVSVLQAEIIDNDAFAVLNIEYEDVLGGIEIIQRHNLNASDAAVLVTFSRFAQWSAQTCFLVASDQRLVRAAEREGFQTLNPETLSAEALRRIIGGL